MDCARNIITANFSGGTSATTAPLWQWDYGQVLCITGIEDLPAAFEVHFSTNRTGGVSTVAVGADGQVTIPNVLLTIGKNLNAWIYLSDAQGEGETEYSITIPVKARPMPETYDAEATGEFDDVVRQVSEYAQTAQTAADNAGASATAAAGSASAAAADASSAAGSAAAAEQAKDDAVTAKGQAETAAQTATQKAQQTAQNAEQAASDAGRAESAAQRAETAQTGAESAVLAAEAAARDAAASASAASASATSAGQAASAAAQSASAAAQSAASIEGDVQTATQKASEAQTAAGQAVTAKDAAVTAQTAAETAATNAGQSASTATTKAAEAAQSASNAAASETAAEAAATRAEQAAASIVVDDELSDTSENPVQNKVITGEVTQVKSAISEIDTFLHKTTVDEHSRNRFDISAAVDGLLQSDGTVVETSNRTTSDFIPVTSGTAYRNCYWNGTGTTNLAVRYSLYYDADKNIIGVGPTTSTGTFTATGLAYIRYTTNTDHAAECMLLLGNTSTAGITEYIPYVEEQATEYGKKYRVVANGDSITYGHKPSADGYDGMTNGVSYMTMACEELGFELDNYSVSMSTLTVNSDGTDTHQALVNRYSQMSDDADLVYIAIGSNDWYYDNADLGTMADRVNNTFYGAMHLLCQGLRAKYGNIPIIFATPIKRWIVRDSSSTIPGNLNLHSEPITDICDAMKEVCEYYGIPVVDMYAESFLNPWLDYDRTNWVPDGTHPNKSGHERMEITCLATLRKYLPIIDKRVSV